METVPRFGPDQYVPVVKTLPGEFRALLHARPALRRRITPLVEVANRQGEDGQISSRSPLAHVVEHIADAAGLDRPYFLDFHDGLPERTITRLLIEARGHGLPFVPVLSPDKVSQTRAVLGTIAFERGVCLRTRVSGKVYRTGQSLDHQIDLLLDATGVGRGDCDLVLDLGYISQQPGYTAKDLQAVINGLSKVEAYRNLVVIGTSIPETLASIGHDTIAKLRRLELLYWYALRELPLRRVPSFGDYIIQAPRRPSGMGRPVANIRYTSHESVLLLRGHRLEKGDRAQYRSLCRQLVARPEFRGRTFSWGDAQIADYASGVEPPLGQQHWRAIGSSHHLEDAVEALRG